MANLKYCNLFAVRCCFGQKKMPSAVFSGKGLRFDTSGYNTDNKTSNTRGFRKSWQNFHFALIVF